MNPGGSVKDRIAFRMIAEAERRGDLKPGGTIVEATAGNTGMGLLIAAARSGYRVVLVMSTKTSTEKVELMRALGAEVIIVPKEAPPDSPDNFRNKSRAVAQERGAWLVDQFSNADNIAAHFEGTAHEIWQQTDGKIDVFIAGCGTGGTISGVARFLRQNKPDAQVVLADPAGSILRNMVMCNEPGEFAPSIIEGMGGAIVPDNLKLPLMDHAVHVSDAQAIGAALDLYHKEGIFAGGSTGCIVAAARSYCLEAGVRNKTIVALAPDGGRGYLSTIYNADWRQARGFAT